MTMELPPGYRVGSWEVREPIASGAFGSVYEGRREEGEPQRAALKFLPTGTRTPRQLHHLRDLTQREVSLLRTLQRPRLIRMHEVLTVDDPQRPEVDGACVLVLEQAHTSLDRLLADGGLIPSSLLVQVCEGLAQLHTAGWVHGDLKPANVLLMRDSTVRLCDFNLAAELEGTHAYSPAFSTPDYTPPELLWSEIGERGQRIRPSTDMWAFGVLVHRVLTGAFPFPGGTSSARRDAALRYAQGGEGLRLSPELPDSWRQIVIDCLAPSHEERASFDAASLLRRCEEAAGTSPAPRLPLSRRRRVRLGALLVAAGLALIAGTATVTSLVVDGNAGARESASRDTVEPHGYDRCKKGYVCFFTEPAGAGKMCSWYGFDEDWQTGTISCPWSGRQAPRSVFNNGVEGKYTAVAYFREDDHHKKVGCISRLSRADLPEDLPKLRSHSWVTHC
ncbi:protein kinase [Streptomyces cacaoi]